MQRRNTNQRQIVYDSLMALGHADTEMLINYINKNYENISLATIYRNLTILMDDNKVRKLKLGTKDIYETVKEKHYHFVCKYCNSIIDIDPALVSLNVPSTLLGEEVEGADIMFYGVCKNCKNI